MRYGVSFYMGASEQVALAKQAGFDYVECNFQLFVRGGDEMLNAYRNALCENEILVESANCFIPGDLPIIGTDHNRAEMREFIDAGMRVGSEMGLKTVAFGSGGARRLPEEIPAAEGLRQLAAFLRETAGPIAAKYGVAIAVEPLRRDECNMIHTLDEGAMLTLMAGQPNVFVLADVYHMWGAGEDYAALRRFKGSIAHGHISNPEPTREGAKRTFPVEKDEFDFKGFVDALAAVGCKRCSIEADCFDFPTEIAKAGPLLKSL